MQRSNLDFIVWMQWAKKAKMAILGRAEAAKEANWEPVMERFLNGQPPEKFVRF
jgi:hypothetical protein